MKKQCTKWDCSKHNGGYGLPCNDGYETSTPIQEESIDNMVRDFCSVVPKSKSEVRKRLENIVSTTEVRIRDSERNRIFAILRHLKFLKLPCEPREIMKIHKEWEESRIANAFSKE
jgi:hypothetical protein